MGQRSIDKLKNILVFLVVGDGPSTDVAVGEWRANTLLALETGGDGMDQVLVQCGNMDRTVAQDILKDMFTPYGNGYTYNRQVLRKVLDLLPEVTLEV